MDNKFSIEDAFERLKEINEKLEDPSVKLQDSLQLYSEGVKLVSDCKMELESVEKEIKILNEV